MICPKCGEALNDTVCGCGLDLKKENIVCFGNDFFEQIQSQREAFACLYNPNTSEESSGVKWDYDGPFIYDGKVKTVVLSSKEKEVGFIDRLFGRKPEVRLIGVPEGYEAVYENNTAVDAGVYQATAKLLPKDKRINKEIDVEPLQWEILKAIPDMSSVKWNYSKPFTYDGNERSVELSGLPECVTVSYMYNTAVDAGKYKAVAVVRAKDQKNFEAPRVVENCNWQIKKASYDLTQVRWIYDDDLYYDGEEKTVRLAGLPKGVKVEAYRGNKAVEIGNYNAEVIVKYDNKDNYEEPVIPSLNWRIRKHHYDTSNVRWTFEDDFYYDGREKSVRLTGLPRGVKVEAYRGNRAVEAGNYMAEAFVKYDNEYYEAPYIPSLKWRIQKGHYDTSAVHWTYEEPFIYDGNEKAVFLRGVPESITIRYRDNKASAIGDYTAKAYLTYDNENYNAPHIDNSLDWAIIPRDE